MRVLFAIGQSSLFAKEEQQKKQVVTKLVNKGSESPLSFREIETVIEQLVLEGSVSNRNATLGLSAKAFKILDPERYLHERQASMVQEEAVDEEEKVAKIAIDPTILISPHDGALHVAQLKKNRQIGFRALEVLAELELARGVIQEQAHVSAILRARTGSSNDYRKTVESLVRHEYLSYEGSKNKTSLILLEKGREVIAQLKKDEAFLMSRKAPEKLSAEALLRIFEFIINEVGCDDTGSAWLSRPDSKGKGRLTVYMASQMGISEDALLRRLYDARELKGYLEAKKGRGAKSEITSLRITEKGIAYMKQLQQYARKKEKVLDERDVDMLERMTQRVLELSRSLPEWRPIAESLQRSRDRKHLFEYSEAEFAQECKDIKKLLKHLERDLEFENG